MTFDWVLLKVIHLDVNSDVNPQPFFDVVLRAPSAGITATSVWIWRSLINYCKVINEIGVKFDWVLLKVIHLDVNSDVNSQPFLM